MGFYRIKYLHNHQRTIKQTHGLLNPPYLPIDSVVGELPGAECFRHRKTDMTGWAIGKNTWEPQKDSDFGDLKAIDFGEVDVDESFDLVTSGGCCRLSQCSSEVHLVLSGTWPYMPMEILKCQQMLRVLFQTDQQHRNPYLNVHHSQSVVDSQEQQFSKPAPNAVHIHAHIHGSTCISSNWISSISMNFPAANSPFASGSRRCGASALGDGRGSVPMAGFWAIFLGPLRDGVDMKNHEKWYPLVN